MLQGTRILAGIKISPFGNPEIARTDEFDISSLTIQELAQTIREYIALYGPNIDLTYCYMIRDLNDMSETKPDFSNREIIGRVIFPATIREGKIYHLHSLGNDIISQGLKAYELAKNTSLTVRTIYYPAYPISRQSKRARFITNWFLTGVHTVSALGAATKPVTGMLGFLWWAGNYATGQDLSDNNLANPPVLITLFAAALMSVAPFTFYYKNSEQMMNAAVDLIRSSYIELSHRLNCSGLNLETGSPPDAYTLVSQISDGRAEPEFSRNKTKYIDFSNRITLANSLKLLLSIGLGGAYSVANVSLIRIGLPSSITEIKGLYVLLIGTAGLINAAVGVNYSKTVIDIAIDSFKQMFPNYFLNNAEISIMRTSIEAYFATTKVYFDLMNMKGLPKKEINEKLAIIAELFDSIYTHSRTQKIPGKITLVDSITNIIKVINALQVGIDCLKYGIELPTLSSPTASSSVEGSAVENATPIPIPESVEGSAVENATLISIPKRKTAFNEPFQAYVNLPVLGNASSFHYYWVKFVVRSLGAIAAASNVTGLAQFLMSIGFIEGVIPAHLVSTLACASVFGLNYEAGLELEAMALYELCENDALTVLINIDRVTPPSKKFFVRGNVLALTAAISNCFLNILAFNKLLSDGSPFYWPVLIITSIASLLFPWVTKIKKSQEWYEKDWPKLKFSLASFICCRREWFTRHFPAIVAAITCKEKEPSFGPVLLDQQSVEAQDKILKQAISSLYELTEQYVKIGHSVLYSITREQFKRLIGEHSPEDAIFNIIDALKRRFNVIRDEGPSNNTRLKVLTAILNTISEINSDINLMRDHAGVANRPSYMPQLTALTQKGPRSIHEMSNAI